MPLKGVYHQWIIKLTCLSETYGVIVGGLEGCFPFRLDSSSPWMFVFVLERIKCDDNETGALLLY